MKELKYNIESLFKRKELYIAIIGILLVNLIHVFLVIDFNQNKPIENCYRAEYLNILYSADVLLNAVVVVIFPILSATIFSDSSWNERKNKVDTVLHPRLNYKKLVVSRFLVIIAVAFLVNLLGFLMNYFTLSCIYGNGNAKLPFVHDAPFLIYETPEFFLDFIRARNPILFTICICTHVSFLIALLSGLTYSVSFFLKQKIFIYCFPFLFIVFSEFILDIFQLYNFKVIKQLQPMTRFTFSDALVVYAFIIISSVIGMAIHLRKKDMI